VTANLLTGIRVLEFGGIVAARTGRILADLGAEVVLVEPPGGSRVRTHPPLFQTPGGGQVSALFAYTAAAKRSITLDLATQDGALLLEHLVRSHDVVIVDESLEALRPVGLDYESVRAVNDRLVYASITAFGTTGPRRDWRGTDLTAWAASGGLMTIGDPDRGPLAPGGGTADAVGALNAVAGIVLALRTARRRGQGQMVDISLQEAVLSVRMDYGVFSALEGAAQTRTGHRRGAASGHFPTKDGMVELFPIAPRQWDALASWIREDLGIEEAEMETFRGSSLVRMPYRDLIDSWVEALSGRYTKQEFFEEAQRRHIPCGPVNKPADLLHDPQLLAVDGWADIEVPEIGTVRWPKPGIRFNDEELTTGPVPTVGQHNDEIYLGELRLEPAKLAQLRDAGTI
jgi:benzylsuccinate CoA-transferase BbsE subunit